MIIENMDFVVYYLPFPLHIHGVIDRSEDGYTNIYINSRMPVERKRSALKHELMHIIRNDLESPLSVQEIESQVMRDISALANTYDRDGYPMFKEVAYAR